MNEKDLFLMDDDEILNIATQLEDLGYKTYANYIIDMATSLDHMEKQLNTRNEEFNMMQKDIIKFNDFYENRVSQKIKNKTSDVKDNVISQLNAMKENTQNLFSELKEKWKDVKEAFKQDCRSCAEIVKDSSKLMGQKFLRFTHTKIALMGYHSVLEQMKTSGQRYIESLEKLKTSLDEGRGRLGNAMRILQGKELKEVESREHKLIDSFIHNHEKNVQFTENLQKRFDSLIEKADKGIAQSHRPLREVIQEAKAQSEQKAMHMPERSREHLDKER